MFVAKYGGGVSHRTVSWNILRRSSGWGAAEGSAQVSRNCRTWLSVAAVWIACGTAVLYAQGDARQNALSLEQQGRNGEAETAWQAIAKSDPRNAEAFAHMGLTESRQERYEEAVANYR